VNFRLTVLRLLRRGVSEAEISPITYIWDWLIRVKVRRVLFYCERLWPLAETFQASWLGIAVLYCGRTGVRPPRRPAPPQRLTRPWSLTVPMQHLPSKAIRRAITKRRLLQNSYFSYLIPLAKKKEKKVFWKIEIKELKKKRRNFVHLQKCFLTPIILLLDTVTKQFFSCCKNYFFLSTRNFFFLQEYLILAKLFFLQ